MKHMKEYINAKNPNLLHGGDYNPEQWLSTPQVWDEDMILMKKANCNEMTVGIFSWAYLEPRENEYDFTILDTIIDKIYKNGGKVILATPSGARPIWMAKKYPEVLRVNKNGERLHFRDRHNHCYTSPIYREKVAKINQLLAKRYGNNPAVIAWHISNEYGGECFCPLCQKAFQNYLKERYKTIENLNAEYWSSFWSLKYENFEQIEPPTDLTISALNALTLDWKRFVSHQTADFIHSEVAAIKSVSNLPVTTNMMWKHHLNYWEIADELDFASWDAYPDWTDPYKTASEVAFWHDLFRSLKGRPFLMMESALGLVNWNAINRLKRPKIDKLHSLQAVAHGSDGVLYFQFRKGRGGQEKFHGAIVDHVGNDQTRIFKIATDIGNTLSNINDVAGAKTVSHIAILFDKENNWAIDCAMGFNRKDKGYTKTCETYYRTLWKKGINVDIINSQKDFDLYDIIIAPMLYSISEKTINKINDYVKKGGTFYATYMFGMVNENDKCYLNGFPALSLKETFGIWNEEIDSLYPNEKLSVAYNGNMYYGCDYCENVHKKGAISIATILTDFGEMPALLLNKFGKGKAYYQTFRDDGTFFEAVLDNIYSELNIKREVEKLPPYVTLHTRENEEKTFIFVENYGQSNQRLQFNDEVFDMESGKKILEAIIEPLEIKVYYKIK